MASTSFIVQGSRPGAGARPTSQTRGMYRATRNTAPLTAAQRRANVETIRNRARAAARANATRRANARRGR